MCAQRAKEVRDFWVKLLKGERKVLWLNEREWCSQRAKATRKIEGEKA